MQIRKESITIRDLTTKFEDNKIKNCLSFQRQACWKESSEVSYVSGIAANRYPGVLLAADVNECSSNDYYSDFWKDLSDNGYELLSIDGNNRTTTLSRFVNNEFKIKFHGKRLYFNEMSPDDQEHFLNREVDVVVHLDVSREECTAIFLEHNESEKLRPQEKRNAMLYKISPVNREFELRVRNRMVDLKLFKQDNPFRKNDEMLLWLLCYLEDYTKMTNKKRLDEVWSLNEVEIRSDYNRLKSFVTKVIPDFLSYFKFKGASTEIAIRDLAIMFGYLHSNDIKPSRATTSVFIGGLAKKLFKLMKSHQEEFPNELKDGTNVPYSTLVERHQDALYFPARVEALIKYVLKPALEDAQESKSAERSNLASQKSTRYELWKTQSFVCPATKKDIADPLSPEWEVDHVIPLEEGGPDELENFQLVCKDYNRSKGANIEYTLDPA